MLIAAAIPEVVAANREEVAEALLSAAALKVGRMPSVMFNRQLVEFDLISGKYDYKVGSDILSGYTNFWNFESLWMKDSPGKRVRIVGLDHFSAKKRASTSTGYPEYGTIHSKDHTLEVFPTPNSNYTLRAMAKGNLFLSDVPDEYYDVLIKQSFLLAQAMRSGNVAAMLVDGDEKEIQMAHGTNWTGTLMRSYHRLAPEGGNRATSDNLTSE